MKYNNNNNNINNNNLKPKTYNFFLIKSDKPQKYFMVKTLLMKILLQIKFHIFITGVKKPFTFHIQLIFINYFFISFF